MKKIVVGIAVMIILAACHSNSSSTVTNDSTIDKLDSNRTDVTTNKIDTASAKMIDTIVKKPMDTTATKLDSVK